MKKVFLVIFFLIFLIGNINYISANDIKLENKLYFLINQIIDKQIKLNGAYGGYKKVYDFNNKVKKLKSKNQKIESLKKALKKSMTKYETQLFNKKDIIYVEDLNNPYTYFNGKKFNIFVTDDNIKTKKYKVCNINKRDNCINYDRTLFGTNVFVNELKLNNKKIYTKNHKIYIRENKAYFPDTENFISGKTSLTMFLTKLDYNNTELFFGDKYNKISEFGIYTDKKGISFLGLYKDKIISETDFSNKKNINKEAIIKTIVEDSYFGDIIKKNYIKKLEDIDKNLYTIKNIYDYIKKDISYDTDVYDKYIQTNKIDESKYYVFTGIGAYKNKKAVCSGYSSYFQYLLALKNFKNLEIITGEYIDLNSGILVPHSWNKIGNKYYDITFDDGLSISNKDLYFNLPFEVIEVDRIKYNEKTRLKKVKKMTNKERQIYVWNKYLELAKKKEYKDIQLLAPYRILNKIGISKASNFSLNKIWNKTKEKYIFELNDKGITVNFKNAITGKNVNVKQLEIIHISNIEELLQSIQVYNIKNLILSIDQYGKFYIIISIKK